MHGFSPYILLLAAVLVIISVVTGRFISRYGFSTLLVTLVIGMLFGNGGPYDFDYNYPGLTLHISELALCFIIFTGGFESPWQHFKSYALKGVMLASVGVLLTTLVMGLLIHYLLHWRLDQSLLLGAIISGTDAAAVFSILESSGIKLKNGIGEILQIESGTNDPMAYFLTVSITLFMLNGEEASYGVLTLDFFRTMLLGSGSGWLIGNGIFWLIKKSRLKKGQNPVVLIATVILIYSANMIIDGSAFLAVYVAGIVLGNKNWPNRQMNVHFFEGLSWLMETILFLILGLQLYIFRLEDILWEGLIVSAILIFIARPVGTHASLIFTKGFSLRDSAFISWMGLRGATPIVFALIPVVSRVPGSDRLFDIAFIVVISSVLLQGTFIGWLARKLRVSESQEIKT